jgi:hypothetical protein
MKAYRMICGCVHGSNRRYEFGEIATEDKFPSQNIQALVEQGFMEELTDQEQAEFEKKKEEKSLSENLDAKLSEQTEFEKREAAVSDIDIEDVRKKLQSKGVRYGKNESKEALIEKLKVVSE